MTGIFLLSAGCALVDWIATGADRGKIQFVSKPATLLLLTVWFALAAPRPWPAMAAWFAAGLAFSLVGDVLLLLPDRWFLGALVAFLLAQLAYVAALNSEGFVLSARSGAAAFALVAFSLWFFSRLRRALTRKGEDRMVIPVAIYVAAISAMAWSAASTTLRPAWPASAAALAATGGGLFYASDAILGWDRFVRPFSGARLLSRVTYHLGQFGLAAGALAALRG